MTRVILTVLLLCQSFCLTAAEIGFTEPGLLSASDAGRPRVVVVRDNEATRAFRAQPEMVAQMVERGVMGLTGEATAAAAWGELVGRQDVVGIKVYSTPGPVGGTRPAVAEAVVRGLIGAGHPREQIVIWDRRLEDLRNAGFTSLAAALGVKVAGAADEGYDAESFYENPVLGQLVFGDLEFGRAWEASRTNGVVGVTGRQSHYSRLLTRRLTRLINIAPLLNHQHAGVSGVLYTVASACTDNFLRFETNPTLLATAVPEIYGSTNIADRVALNIVDALVGQYEGRRQSLLQYAGAPNELWFGRDPVAMDVLAIEELNRIRLMASKPAVTNRFELYGNARLLELGMDDLREIRVLRLD